MTDPIQFRRHPDADARIASAKRLVRLLLDATDLYPAHRKEFIKLALWKVTEAEGTKLNTRFRSERAILAPSGKLQHEHVFERAKMADALIAHPELADQILDRAVGCLVTDAEHVLLNTVGKIRPDLDGWDRYRHAGISVIDLMTGEKFFHADDEDGTHAGLGASL
jgi:hypothetical protein